MATVRLIIVVQNQLELTCRSTPDSDSAGEIQMMPSSDPKCTGSSKDTGFGTCLGKDTTSLANNEYWINPGQFRDFRGELERNNTFIFINHEMDNGSELFAELGRYDSEYRRLKEPAGDFSTALLNIGRRLLLFKPNWSKFGQPSL